MKRVTRELTILNRLGLHARPSAMFAKVSGNHKSEVWVEKDGETVNGKSIMGLMMLAAGQGSKLRFSVKGKDAKLFLDEMDALFVRKFDES
jgi:phosphocarrier protein